MYINVVEYPKRVALNLEKLFWGAHDIEEHNITYKTS